MSTPTERLYGAQRVWADRMQKMYDDRTAGDHSFSGLLALFLDDALAREAIACIEAYVAIEDDADWAIFDSAVRSYVSAAEAQS